MRYGLGVVAVWLLCVAVLADSPAPLSGPYEDPLQQEIPFGRNSYELVPWRAYMDTWPASQLLGIFGTSSNGIRGNEAEAFATVLERCGVRTCRVEIGWGSLNHDDPTHLLAHAEKENAALLSALAKHHVRPLILLNANSGYPMPIRSVRVEVVQAAAAGSRTLTLRPEDIAGLRPGYTGLRDQQKRRIGYPLIVATDATTGVCQLSAPLNVDVPAGKLQLADLKYHPFSDAVMADGSVNPFAQETLDGWATYVRTILALGNAAAGPGGFDLEVWNEYTFGSDILDEKRYYSPPRSYNKQVSYTAHGLTRSGHEVILPMTIDIAAAEDPGVGVISGFSNQRPWENGTDMWPGQLGFSRHYYTGANTGDFNGGSGLLSPTTEQEKFRTRKVLDALGHLEGAPDPANPRDPWSAAVDSMFIPTLMVQMPEVRYFGYRTEFQTRDCQPWPGPWPKHFR